MMMSRCYAENNTMRRREAFGLNALESDEFSSTAADHNSSKKQSWSFIIKVLSMLGICVYYVVIVNFILMMN